VRRGYTGPMNVQETILPQARRLRVTPDLSPEARRRLHWMDYLPGARAQRRPNLPALRYQPADLLPLVAAL